MSVVKDGVRQGEQVVEHFCKEVSKDLLPDEEAVRDILTVLQHYCEAKGFNYRRIDNRAAQAAEIDKHLDDIKERSSVDSRP